MACHVGVVCRILYAIFCNEIIFFSLLFQNIMFFPGTTIGERLLYIPSIAFCILLARIFTFGLRKPNTKLWVFARILGLLLASVTIVAYGLKTYEQNPVWDNDPALFAAALKTCPNSAKVHYILAGHDLDAERFQQAIKHYQKALEIGYPYFISIIL